MAKIIIEISKKQIRKTAALLDKDLTDNQVDDLYSKDVAFSLEELSEYIGEEGKLAFILLFLSKTIE
jgi:hypothetical protein